MNNTQTLTASFPKHPADTYQPTSRFGKSKPAQLSDLPDEILSDTFNRLGPIAAVMVAATCERHRRIVASDSDLWIQHGIRPPLSLTPPANATLMSTWGKQFKKLTPEQQQTLRAAGDPRFDAFLPESVRRATSKIQDMQRLVDCTHIASPHGETVELEFFCQVGRPLEQKRVRELANLLDIPVPVISNEKTRHASERLMARAVENAGDAYTNASVKFWFREADAFARALGKPLPSAQAERPSPDAFEQQRASSSKLQVVSGPMPDTVTTLVQASDVTLLGRPFARRGLNVVRNPADLPERVRPTEVDFGGGEMLVSYESQRDSCSSSGYSLKIKQAGFDPQRTLHLFAEKTSPEGGFFLCTMDTRKAAFAVPETDGEVVLHIDNQWW